MASKYFRSRNKNSKSRKLLIKRGIIRREKQLLESHYSFLNYKIKKNILIVQGEFKPTVLSSTYSYRVKYDGEFSPSVYIDEPLIDYSDDIHMYPEDNSLCLYFPKDMPWDSRNHHLFDTIIPWTHEWIVFYEKYLISGKWEHPFVPHLIKKDKA